MNMRGDLIPPFLLMSAYGCRSDQTGRRGGDGVHGVVHGMAVTFASATVN